MLKMLQIRWRQGFQYIRDPLRACPPLPYRGLPRINADRLSAVPGFSCPSGALRLDPLAIDLGKCLFCGDCAAASPHDEIEFTNDPRLASVRREDLFVDRGHAAPAVEPHAVMRRLCRRSFKLRQVSAGGAG